MWDNLGSGNTDRGGLPDVGDYIRSFIEDFASKKGSTILLASHNMNEVERLCHEVMMMKNVDSSL